MSFRVILHFQPSHEVHTYVSAVLCETYPEAQKHRDALIQDFRRLCIGSEIRYEHYPERNCNPVQRVQAKPVSRKARKRRR